MIKISKAWWPGSSKTSLQNSYMDPGVNDKQFSAGI